MTQREQPRCAPSAVPGDQAECPHPAAGASVPRPRGINAASPASEHCTALLFAVLNHASTCSDKNECAFGTTFALGGRVETHCSMPDPQVKQRNAMLARASL